MRLPESLARYYKAGAILPLLFLGVAFAHARPKVVFAHARPKVESSHAQAISACSYYLWRLTFTYGDMKLLTNALRFTRMPTLLLK